MNQEEVEKAIEDVIIRRKTRGRIGVTLQNMVNHFDLTSELDIMSLLSVFDQMVEKKELIRKPITYCLTEEK